MALSGIGTDITGQAGATIAAQYLAVHMNSDGQYDVPGGDGCSVDGFVQTARTSTDTIVDGDAITIRIEGITKAICAAAGVTRGDKLMSSSTGTMLTATGAGVTICGRALETASSGDVFRIQIVRGTLHA